jgi:16S rRNA (guanine527-N7)-methyltransferase
VKHPPAARRLEQLSATYGLGDGERAALAALVAALADEAAPTTVHDPRRAVDVHVADALVALTLPEVRSARRLADLGAGPGVPALVLAAALPEARVFAVESANRKCAFLEATVTSMGLANVEVVHARAEEWTEGIGAMDVVCVRAVAALPVVVEYAAPLLREGGALVAWKGAVEDAERADGDFAAEATGLEAVEVRAVEPFPSSDRRTLHLYRKVAATPDRYPRRAGMATKRPLSAKKHT